jgi:hypothetical protein
LMGYDTISRTLWNTKITRTNNARCEPHGEQDSVAVPRTPPPDPK